MKPTQKEIKKIESLNYLKEIIKPGQPVYTVLLKVSNSGMSRQLKVLTIIDNKIKDIGNEVATILDYRLAKNNDWSVIIGGCGMDMGFHLVTQLSYALGYNGTPITGEPVESTNAYGLNHYWL